MPYSQRIRSLEESHRLVDIQIANLEKQEPINEEKLQKLRDARNKYLSELRDLRRAQYEYHQTIDFGDDR